MSDPNTMDKPLVSVLLPVFNAEQFLKVTLDSLFAQTFQDFEVVVIDDGSTDRSGLILQGYEDPRLEVFRNDHNLGLIKSLNVGLDLCRGKYVARIDADDCALPHRLQVQTELLEKNPDTVFVFSDRIAINEAGKKIDVHNRMVYGDGLIRWKLLTGNFVTHSSVMIRKESIRKPLFDDKYLHAEDYAAWLALLSEGKFAAILEPLVKYRFHGGSVSAQNRKTQVYSALLALQSHLFITYDSEFSMESLALWSSPEDSVNSEKPADFLALLKWMHPMNTHFSFFPGYWARVNALYHYYRRLTFLVAILRARSDLILPIAKAFLSLPFPKGKPNRTA